MTTIGEGLRTRTRRIFRLQPSNNVVASFLFGLIAAAASGQSLITDLATGAGPAAAAANPVTNKIYVANSADGTVTVVDGATYATMSVAVGVLPAAIAVDAITNKVYVANAGSDTVTVIDGATNQMSAIPVGNTPVSLGINPVTNTIYVVNKGDSSVTVINGGTNSTTKVAAGSGPIDVAVNPVSNKIYVVNGSGNTVSVIDGATNGTGLISVGKAPAAVAVNAVTNKIYVANSGDGTVTVIDGATSKTTAIAAGSQPTTLGVNPVANKIYVGDQAGASVTVIDGATNTTTAVATGSQPAVRAVNPATDQVYVANGTDKALTVVNGLTNQTVTLATNEAPVSVAVNQITNRVFASQEGANKLTVIEGAEFVPKDIGLYGANLAAANPVTNKIYMTISSHNTVAVIDGATQATELVPVGDNPGALAVNPSTNRIYVANTGSNNITVIDGAANTTTALNLGGEPDFVEVNPVTDRIYVTVHATDGTGRGWVAVIGGDTNSITSVPVGRYPSHLAINTVTNKIYVVSGDDNSVTVIDGTTNDVATIGVGDFPVEIAVDPTINRVYVGDYAGLEIIDGQTNLKNTLRGILTDSLAVNPLTDKLYVGSPYAGLKEIDGRTERATIIAGSSGELTLNSASNQLYVSAYTIRIYDLENNQLVATTPGILAFHTVVNPVTNQIYTASVIDTVTVISEPKASVPLTTAITPLPGNRTNSPAPVFTFKAQSGTAAKAQAVYFQVDSRSNSWIKAKANGSEFQGTTAAIAPGFHILYAFAVDGQQSGSGKSSSPSTGAIAAYGFVEGGGPQPTTTQLALNPGTSVFGQAVTLTATVQAASGQPSGSVTFTYNSNFLGSSMLTNGVAMLTTSVLPAGSTVIQANFVGNSQFASSSGNATEVVTASAPPAVISVLPASGEGQSQAFSASYSDTSGVADLNDVRILIHSTTSSVRACYAIYYPASKALYLTDDAGAQSLPKLTPGVAGSVSNSQCTLSGQGTSVSISGNALTVTFALTLGKNYGGKQNVFLQATKRNGVSTGAAQKGTWTVPGLVLSRSTYAFTSSPNVARSGRIYITNISEQAVFLSPTMQGSSAFSITNSCGTIQPYSFACPFGIVYKPTSLGSDSATIQLNPSMGPNTTISLTGISVSAGVLVAKGPITFLTPVGTVQYQRVYITNNLPYTLNLLPALPGSEFSISNYCSAISPSATCGINIRFAPLTIETFSGFISLNFQNAPAGTPSQVAFKTSSAGMPPFFVSETKVQIVTPLGTVQSSGPITITNNTAQPVALKPAIISSSAFSLSSTCPESLAASASCSLTVRFAPTTDQINLGTIALNLQNAPGGAPTTIQLAGYAPDPGVVSLNGVSGSFAVEYAQIPVPSTNAGTFQITTLTVLNGTPHTITLAPSISAGEGSAVTFQLLNSCTSIPAHGVCQMTARYEPLQAGIFEGYIELNASNLQEGDSIYVVMGHLSGVGLPMP